MVATIQQGGLARRPLEAPPGLERKLAAARQRIMTGMAIVPEASLNRHERGLVNQVLERHYRIGHLRRDIRLPNARVVRPGMAHPAATQTMFLHFLAIPEARVPTPCPAPAPEANIYASAVPDAAWQRHAEMEAADSAI
jgi:hypothetical protein